MTSEPRTNWLRILCASALALLALTALFLSLRWFHAARERSFSNQNACISMLRIIEGAKGQAAAELGIKPNQPITQEQIAPYVRPMGNHPPFICLEGGAYSINTLNKPPTCSFPGHELPGL